MKRITGILYKGDTVKLDNDSIHLVNLLYKVSEHYIIRNENESIDSIKCYILTQNHYFVTGDNFENSRDSRSFGYIPEQSIIGKINTVFISIDRSEDGNSKLRCNRFFFKIE